MSQSPHVHFGNVRAIIRECVEHFWGVRIREIQPCPLDQAYVRFFRDFDRDSFIFNSPIPHGDVTLSFARYNERWNHRTFLFNRECWILLLNLPSDYWKQVHMERIFAPFGQLVSWEGNSTRLASVVAKIRVENLESIPHFIPFLVGDGLQGESWTLQCEILQHQLLRNAPADEDLPLAQTTLGLIFLSTSLVLVNQDRPPFSHLHLGWKMRLQIWPKIL